MAEDASTANSRAWTAGWLAAGAILRLFANGRWIIAPAAWLAPPGWLVFLDRAPAARGILAAFPLFLLTEFVIWRGIIPAPGLLYFLVTGIYGLVYFLPFAIHRLIAPRISGFVSTLAFPAAWVSVEFAFQRWVTPYGSWGSLAYTQTDYLSFLQAASLAGIPGLTFLGAWFGSVAAWILRPGRTARASRRAAAGYSALLFAVLAFGHVRLARPEPEGELVRAAGLVPSPQLMAELEAGLAPLRRGESLSGADLDALAGASARLNDDLFERTRREARAGARLVAWSETAARVLKRDELAFRARASLLAADQGVDLILGYGVLDLEARLPFENKVVAVAADGRVAWDYHKAHPIIGAESPFMRAGAGVIRVLETSYGRIGAVICHDLDFPALLWQASRQGIGLLVAPSDDWSLITPLHADMSIPRAIENGFWLFRPTSGGRSIVTDSRGRTVAAVDYAEDAIVAQVKAVRVRTVYGAVGDLFAWLCLAGMVVLAVAALRGYGASPRRTSS